MDFGRNSRNTLKDKPMNDNIPELMIWHMDDTEAESIWLKLIGSQAAR